MSGVYDLARGYQIAFSYRDVAAEVDALVRMAGSAPDRVLEIASGPAEHAVEFARRGASATALDLSEAMTARATENAAAAGVTIQVVRADMREFALPYQVNLAFCMISSISHVLTLDDLISHFASVRGALLAGGCYIVEGSHPTDYLGKKSVQSEWDTTVDGTTVRLSWGAEGDTIDPVTQVTPLHVTMTIIGEDGSSQTSESQELDRFWTRDEFEAAARLAGLRLEAQYGGFEGESLSDERAWRMILVFRNEKSAP
jgi:Methyltransferase domain